MCCCVAWIVFAKQLGVGLMYMIKPSMQFQQQWFHSAAVCVLRAGNKDAVLHTSRQSEYCSCAELPPYSDVHLYTHY